RVLEREADPDDEVTSCLDLGIDVGVVVTRVVRLRRVDLDPEFVLGLLQAVESGFVEGGIVESALVRNHAGGEVDPFCLWAITFAAVIRFLGVFRRSIVAALAWCATVTRTDGDDRT